MLKKTALITLLSLGVSLPAYAQSTTQPNTTGTYHNNNSAAGNNAGSNTNSTYGNNSSTLNNTGSNAGSAAGSSMTDTTGTTSATTTTYPTLGQNEVFASKVKGLNIYNQDNKSIGEIEDVAFDSNRQVQAYIVSVGGFLGVGDRYVAISPSAVKINWDGAAKKWTAHMNATADQLKSAPQFKYPNNS